MKMFDYTRTINPDLPAWIDTAKRVRVEDELYRRGVRLKGDGKARCGPCPSCGGEDRFAINTVKQVFNCRGSGGGSVIDMVMHLDGSDFVSAVTTLGGEDRPRATQRVVQRPVVVPDTGTQDLARALWRAALRIEGTLAETYLIGRGVEIPAGVSGATLRFHPNCPFGNVMQPGMLALYRDIVTDKPRAIGRTPIPDGVKTGSAMSLGPTKGCAIKLSPDTTVTYGLHIGEGVETTLSGMQQGFAPAWAVGSKGAIASFPVLPGVEVLSILVDNDVNDGGLKAAHACVAQWTAAGQEVFLHIPEEPGADMNDLALQIGGAR